MPVASPVAPSSQPTGPLWRTVLTPRWMGLLLLALAIASVMSMLGVWQLDVYQSKTAAATAKRAEGAPIALRSLFSIDDGLPSKAVGRKVTVDGTWGPAADQLFITDRRLGDRDGFWVVTPLLLNASGAGGSTGTPSGSTGSSDGATGSADSSTVAADGSAGAVMVIRGWVPTVSDPAATPPTGQVSLAGAVAQSEAQDASGDAAKGRTLQSLRIPTIVHLVNYRIYDAFVVLSSIDKSAAATPSAPAIVPAPTPPTDHAGLRNVAYAFQWWIFAAFTLWMWGRMVLDAHRDNDSEDPDQPDNELEPSGTVSA